MGEDGTSYIYLTDKSMEWYDTRELDSEEKSMMYLIYSTKPIYEQE